MVVGLVVAPGPGLRGERAAKGNGTGFDVYPLVKSASLMRRTRVSLVTPALDTRISTGMRLPFAVPAVTTGGIDTTVLAPAASVPIAQLASSAESSGPSSASTSMTPCGFRFSRLNSATGLAAKAPWSAKCLYP